jgi:site-specific recombinase XerD
MLDSLFRRPHHIRRLRAGPLGALFDPLVSFLLRRGHAVTFVHQVVRAVEHFGYWLQTQHAEVSADDVTPVSVSRFLSEHLPHCSCPLPFPRSPSLARAALNQLRRVLIPDAPARPLPPATPFDALLTEYDHFLRQTCGLAAQTCLYRRRYAREFLQRCFGDGAPDFRRLRPADFQDYFRHHAGHLKPGSVAVMGDSLRSLIRFLALAHDVDPALAEAIPVAPRWSQDRLPRTLSEADLQAILDHFDTSTPVGRRDLAMVRCMSDLGLRVSEVVALTLDDIDWREGIVTVPAGKARRQRLLPLPAPLGQAITGYLRGGRPSSADRHLFLRFTVPAGTPVTPDLVRDVFRTTYTRITGRSESIGTHVLRHTAAARMRAAGNSLKGIADVLGHRSVDTTAIYVKLDVEALRTVALPWPGGES